MALRAIDFEKIAVGAAPVAITATKVTGDVMMAEFTVDANAVRYRTDGGTVSATDGMYVPKELWPPIKVYGYPNILALRWHQVSAAAVVSVTLYGVE